MLSKILTSRIVRFVVVEVKLTASQWKYRISSNALSLIIGECQIRYPKETGGILIGWRDGLIFQIEIAIGPGPNAIHKRNSFTRDGNFSQSQLDRIVIETNGRLDYLGEWHSHPNKTGPSFTDFNSLNKIKTDLFYNIADPILGIVNYKEDEWQFYCYVLRKIEDW